jgi:hypothetical protein
MRVKIGRKDWGVTSVDLNDEGWDLSKKMLLT